MARNSRGDLGRACACPTGTWSSWGPGRRDCWRPRGERSGCSLAAGEAVAGIDRFDGGFRIATAARHITAAALAITTGGCSYPGCGTTGEGYDWGAKFGHTVVPARPALVPVETSAAWV